MDSITIGKYQFFIDRDICGCDYARYYSHGIEDAQFVNSADNNAVVALIKKLLEIQNDKD